MNSKKLYNLGPAGVLCRNMWMFGLDSSMQIYLEPSPARVHLLVRPGWLLFDVIIDSHTPPDLYNYNI